MPDDARAPAVQRAVRALDVVAHQRRIPPVELGRALDLPKSSVSDLTSTLLEERMLARRGGHLVLGTAFIEMAAGFVGGVATLRRFGIGWERSAVLREHTVTLQSLIGTHSVCVAVRLGARPLPYTPRAGSRQPLWPAAGPEPVLRAVPRAAVVRSLAEFPESSPDDAELRAWATGHRETDDGPDESAEGPLDASGASATGNIELNALVATGESRGGPTVVSLHLPPTHTAGTRELHAALDQFARDLRTRPAS